MEKDDFIVDVASNNATLSEEVLRLHLSPSYKLNIDEIKTIDDVREIFRVLGMEIGYTNEEAAAKRGVTSRLWVKQ